jgi:SAM-dependent methyltransferase
MTLTDALMTQLSAFFRRRRDAQRHALVGRPELWPMKRAFQIDFLRARGLRPSHTLVDLGCGSLRGGIALIDYLLPGHYTGIDVRDSVLDQARGELVREKLTHKRPRLIRAHSLATVELAGPVDVFWAFSVLFHMSDAILLDALGLVARGLAAPGVFYANIIDGEGEPGCWQGFPVVARSLQTYQELAARCGLSVECLGRLDALGHHSGDPSQDSQIMLAMRKA